MLGILSCCKVGTFHIELDSHLLRNIEPAIELFLECFPTKTTDLRNSTGFGNRLM